MRCEASNADTIYWEYRTLESLPWSRNLSTPMRAGSPDPPNGGKLVTLTIDDGNTAQIEDLNFLNGFYQCNAENAEKGYKIQAPPVRIVRPCELKSFTNVLINC